MRYQYHEAHDKLVIDNKIPSHSDEEAAILVTLPVDILLNPATAVNSRCGAKTSLSSTFDLVSSNVSETTKWQWRLPPHPRWNNCRYSCCYSLASTNATKSFEICMVFMYSKRNSSCSLSFAESQHDCLTSFAWRARKRTCTSFRSLSSLSSIWCAPTTWGSCKEKGQGRRTIQQRI